MKRSTVTLAFSLLVTQACMFSPTDGETVSTRSSAVSFQGYHYTPSMAVQLEAFQPSTGTFEDLGSPVMTGTDPQAYDGVDWYAWSGSRVVPWSWWTPGTSGHFARVRASYAGGTMHSVRPGWGACQADNPSVGDFLANCTSENSPEAYVFTSDYPSGTDLVLENMRLSTSGMQARVRNGGREGRITRLECFRQGAAISRVFDSPILPGETQTLQVSLLANPGQSVTCTVFGENVDGSPETIVCGGEPRTCGNNSRTEPASFAW